MPDVIKALIHLSQSFDAIKLMITGFAYVMGTMLFMRALYHLKIYGELRTMMSNNAGMKEPLVMILGASIFMFLPTALGMLNASLFGYETPLSLSYLPPSDTVRYGEAIKAVLGLLQVIGFIAFVRGWTLVVKAAQQGSQTGYGKGLTHIFGGIMAINIVGLRDIVWNTFGFATS